VAVRASDHARTDFDDDPSPCAAAIGQRCDVSDFRTDMIELEHDEVRLAAIDTWVAAQVAHDLFANLLTACVHLSDKARLLALAVLRVVRGVGFREARPAPRLSPGLPAPHRWELSERLRSLALRARLHTGT
jgi:hypothetical protein